MPVINNDKIILKNLEGKKFHVILQSIGVAALYKTGSYPIWLIIFFIYSFFFSFKTVEANRDGIRIIYPLRPIFRKISCSILTIKKIRFNLYNGGKSYSNINFSLSKYPFLFEIRLDKNDDIESVLKLLCTNGKFAIKPLSDKQIMTERIKKITENTNCSVI